MTTGLNLRIFAHSWVSDWNHGNAHFLRGLARSLVRTGQNVRCYEQLGSWSLSNLVPPGGLIRSQAMGLQIFLDTPGAQVYKARAGANSAHWS